MLNFSQQLIGVGFSFIAFLMIATVKLFQIAITFWCLAVDSTSNNNRRIFKWQCLLTTFSAAICLCFGAGVIKLTQDGTFF
jgi:Mn2+/Fe2+ NRAMP family transporter